MQHINRIVINDIGKLDDAAAYFQYVIIFVIRLALRECHLPLKPDIEVIVQLTHGEEDALCARCKEVLTSGKRFDFRIGDVTKDIEEPDPGVLFLVANAVNNEFAKWSLIQPALTFIGPAGIVCKRGTPDYVDLPGWGTFQKWLNGCKSHGRLLELNSSDFGPSGLQTFGQFETTFCWALAPGATPAATTAAVSES